ncbi:hypothetical protein Rleg9DRAFT_6527 [Rhizobium leguminosarum bv. trifolii WSM597]|uniref:Uncharacterized protein n=1 Tax=Rhizobium leguminosarum bv. trifolii WSM597 TaxID=754764 RepID=J0HAX1_RHILT|nr:hypothetical protein [Rhizobium leguminosarum]EJB07513.1 hypothetical protein Rleg9DRAFT_6527 [Rhizobium leguminosarum bv. trifolii WSM597]
MAARHDQNPLALVKAREKGHPIVKSGLTPRIRKAVDFLVFGHPDRPGENLTGRQAAELVGLTWRTIREALDKPAVKAYFQQMYDTLRAAEKPASVRRMADIRDDSALSKTAAGRRTQLEAAKAIAYAPAGHQITIATQINVGAITPGYVIDLTPDHDEERLQIRHEPRTIDAEPDDLAVFTSR